MKNAKYRIIPTPGEAFRYALQVRGLFFWKTVARRDYISTAMDTMHSLISAPVYFDYSGKKL